MYKCTNCRHRQETTDMGMCEECDYENLVEINPRDDLRESIQEWRDLREMSSKADDHTRCPHCMEQLLFCGCIRERAEEILIYGGAEKILLMLNMEEKLDEVIRGNTHSFSMRSASYDGKKPYVGEVKLKDTREWKSPTEGNEFNGTIQPLKFRGAFSQGDFDGDIINVVPIPRKS